MSVRVATPKGAEELAQGARQVANEATANPLVEALLRLGFIVRGLLYGVIGVLALRVVIGGRGQFTDTQGAIAAVARTPWGNLLLYVILAGLVGYGLLGLIRAFLDTQGKGKDAKGIVERVGYALSGASYLLLGVATLNLIRGSAAAAHNGAQGQQLRQGAGTVLSKPWGPWVVGALGLVVIGIGMVQIARGLGPHFDQQFKSYALDADQRRWINRIGRFGVAARGVVFALVGVFLFQAAYFNDPNRAKGIDGVLASLLHQPYGLWLLGVVALGLIAFAVYSALCGVWLQSPRRA